MLISFVFVLFNGSPESQKKTKCSKKSHESFSLSAHQYRQDPTTPTKCGVPLDIYENISFSKFPAGSGYSLTEDQNHNDNNSGIYMSPLPALYM